MSFWVRAPLAIIICSEHTKAWTRPFDRKQTVEVPPKVKYSLSEIGTTLNPVLSQLCNWGNTYHAYMET